MKIKFMVYGAWMSNLFTSYFESKDQIYYIWRQLIKISDFSLSSLQSHVENAILIVTVDPKMLREHTQIVFQEMVTNRHWGKLIPCPLESLN